MKKIHVLKNLLLLTVLVAVSLFSWRMILRNRQTGVALLVRITCGDETVSYPLDRDATYVVEGRLRATIRVEGGAAFFVDSLCPDHLCEGFGRLTKEGDSAVCLPARVAVEIVRKSGEAG